MNTAQELHGAGQSIWYDNIQRSLLDNGELAGMVDRGGAHADKAASLQAADQVRAYIQSRTVEGLGAGTISKRVSVVQDTVR